MTKIIVEDIIKSIENPKSRPSLRFFESSGIDKVRSYKTSNGLTVVDICLTDRDNAKRMPCEWYRGKTVAKKMTKFLKNSPKYGPYSPSTRIEWGREWMGKLKHGEYVLEFYFWDVTGASKSKNKDSLKPDYLEEMQCPEEGVTYGEDIKRYKSGVSCAKCYLVFHGIKWFLNRYKWTCHGMSRLLYTYPSASNADEIFRGIFNPLIEKRKGYRRILKERRSFLRDFNADKEVFVRDFMRIFGFCTGGTRDVLVTIGIGDYLEGKLTFNTFREHWNSCSMTDVLRYEYGKEIEIIEKYFGELN